MAHPGPIIAVAVLGNLGIAAVGTLLSAVANTGRQSSYLLPLLVLPTVIPLVLGAAEATRLAVEHDFGPDWWRWVQLLAALRRSFSLPRASCFSNSPWRNEIMPETTPQ